MNRRRWSLAIAAAIVLASFAVTSGAASAITAIGPDQQGWWSEIQQGPSALPINTVTGNNLEVGNDPATGPNAIAAVRFTVPASIDGASVDPSTVPAVLTLQVAPNTNVGTVAVAACVVQGDWKPAEGGSWNSHPNYSCSQGSVPARFSSDDKTAVLNLTPAMQRGAGVYDLALVPSPGVTDPFSVEFLPAGAGALALGSGSPPASQGGSPVDTTPYAAPVPFGADAGLSAGSNFGASTVAPGSALPLSPAPPAAAASSNQNATPFVTSPLRRTIPFKRGQRAIALAILLALVAALWWFGGQQGRAPRLLGSLGEASSPASSELYVAMGGIGRFARPRTGPPPRL